MAQAAQRRGPDDPAPENDGRPEPGTWVYTVCRLFIMYTLASFASKVLMYGKQQMDGGGGAAPASAPRPPREVASLASGSTASPPLPPPPMTTTMLTDDSWEDERGIRHYPPTGSHIPSDPIMGLPRRRIDGKPMETHWCLWNGRTEMELRVFITPYADWDLERDWPDAWPDNYRYASRASQQQQIGNGSSSFDDDEVLSSSFSSSSAFSYSPATLPAAALSQEVADDSNSTADSAAADSTAAAAAERGRPGRDPSAPWPPLPPHAPQSDPTGAAGRSQLVWHLRDLLLVTENLKSKAGRAAAQAAALQNERELALNFSLPDAVRFGNGSAFAHVFLTHLGAPIDKRQTDWFTKYDEANHYNNKKNELLLNPAATFLRPFDDRMVQHQRYDMTKFSAARKHRKVVSLLGGDREADAANAALVELQEAEGGPGLVSRWKPTLALHLVEQFATFRNGRHAIPGAIASALTFDYASGAYFPILDRSEFWLMAKHLVDIANVSIATPPSSSSLSESPAALLDSTSPLSSSEGGGSSAYYDYYNTTNNATEVVPLTLSFSTMSLWKWQMMSQMETQWREQERSGMTREGESDVVRQLLMDTDPVLLAVTGLVSFLHMLFEFLAFSNDVSFFRRRKDFTGLSLRSMLLQCFFQTVILLYLFDNDTSWVVLMSSSVGLAIEYWKVSKALRFELVSSSTSSSPPKSIAAMLKSAATLQFLRVKEREGANYELSRTKEYDKIAMDHLMFLVVPLVAGYSAFALTHYKYKSWYSWVVSSLVSFIYAFGFVMMTPQLFINYKLKSVAHLPWKAMIYKSLNTFIDDLFAFVIKMPWMHRLSCLRDDVIFLIFLYQRWIYRIDMTRVNEFGQEFDDSSSGNGDGGDGAADGRSITSSSGSGSGGSESADASTVPASTTTAAAAVLPNTGAAGAIAVEGEAAATPPDSAVKRSSRRSKRSKAL